MAGFASWRGFPAVSSASGRCGVLLGGAKAAKTEALLEDLGVGANALASKPSYGAGITNSHSLKGTSGHDSLSMRKTALYTCALTWADLPWLENMTYMDVPVLETVAPVCKLEGCEQNSPTRCGDEVADDPVRPEGLADHTPPVRHPRVRKRAPSPAGHSPGAPLMSCLSSLPTGPCSRPLGCQGRVLVLPCLGTGVGDSLGGSPYLDFGSQTVAGSTLSTIGDRDVYLRAPTSCAMRLTIVRNWRQGLRELNGRQLWVGAPGGEA